MNKPLLISLGGILHATFAPAESPSSSPVAFEPNETLVSAQYDLVDPEYDQVTSRLIWVDSVGNLWLASLDSEGMFQPPDGKGTLIDPDAMTVADLELAANGPEWIQTDEGPKIIYTKFLRLPHALENARIAVAEPVTPEGTEWNIEILNPFKPRVTPYGSNDLGDPNPRFTCGDPDRNHYLVELYHPDREILLPLIEQHAHGVHLVPNSPALPYTAPPPGESTRQVFIYHGDTGVAEQVTFDVWGDKQRAAVWMWPAPEFDGEYVFMVLVSVGFHNKLDVYRQLGSPPVWTKIHTIVVPLSSIGSAEAFTFEGQSYIVFQLTVGSDEAPSSIWLAGIDSENEILQRVTDDTLDRWRSDPEVYITAFGPYVYYNRRDPADPGACRLACSEGIYRAHTGLTPQTTDATNKPGQPILLQNYPNPFNPTTTIAFVTREKRRVTLSIHDVYGTHVNTLIDKTLEKGYWRVTWDGTDSQGSPVASGVYFCRLQSDTETSVKKMVLLR